jgi:hypothetical protein
MGKACSGEYTANLSARGTNLSAQGPWSLACCPAGVWGLVCCGGPTSIEGSRNLSTDLQDCFSLSPFGPLHCASRPSDSEVALRIDSDLSSRLFVLVSLLGLDRAEKLRTWFLIDVCTGVDDPDRCELASVSDSISLGREASAISSRCLPTCFMNWRCEAHLSCPDGLSCKHSGHCCSCRGCSNAVSAADSCVRS